MRITKKIVYSTNEIITVARAVQFNLNYQLQVLQYNDLCY